MFQKMHTGNYCCSSYRRYVKFIDVFQRQFDKSTISLRLHFCSGHVYTAKGRHAAC